MKYSVILLSLLASCTINTYKVDYITSRDAAVDAWEEVVGPLSLECLVRVDCYTVVEVELVGCTVTPPAGQEFVGCAKHSVEEIHILKGRSDRNKAKIAVHEYVHVISRCVFGTGDPKHENRLLWKRLGSNTVEAIGCQKLKEWGDL